MSNAGPSVGCACSGMFLQSCSGICLQAGQRILQNAILQAKACTAAAVLQVQSCSLAVLHGCSQSCRLQSCTHAVLQSTCVYHAALGSAGDAASRGNAPDRNWRGVLWTLPLHSALPLWTLPLHSGLRFCTLDSALALWTLPLHSALPLWTPLLHSGLCPCTLHFHSAPPSLRSALALCISSPAIGGSLRAQASPQCMYSAFAVHVCHSACTLRVCTCVRPCVMRTHARMHAYTHAHTHARTHHSASQKLGITTHLRGLLRSHKYFLHTSPSSVCNSYKSSDITTDVRQYLLGAVNCLFGKCLFKKTN